MRLWIGLLACVCVSSMARYHIEDWVNLKPAASTTGQLLDSAEYQLLLPATKFYGEEGRKQDLAAFKQFLKVQLGNVKDKVDQNVRLVTLYDISLMDPSQDQEEAETEWELKQRTAIDDKGSRVGETDLTIKRGAVPDKFDWHSEYAPIREVGATAVENKFELDIQCAERDFTQATKFTFPPGTVPVLRTYQDLQGYFPKLFHTTELASHLSTKVGWLRKRLGVGEVSFEWNAEVSAQVSGVDVTFVIGTRHNDLENARKGDEGWTIRPPELNWRVKRQDVPSDKQAQKLFLSELERLFNAFLASQWNAHEDCGQWNGVKVCAPGFLLVSGSCMPKGCETAAAPVTKIPRGASAAQDSSSSPPPATSLEASRPSSPLAPSGSTRLPIPNPVVSFAPPTPTRFVTTMPASMFSLSSSQAPNLVRPVTG